MQPSSPLPREPVHFTYLNCSTLVVQYKLLVVPHTHTIPILQCTIQLYYTCEICEIKKICNCTFKAIAINWSKCHVIILSVVIYYELLKQCQ